MQQSDLHNLKSQMQKRNGKIIITSLQMVNGTTWSSIYKTKDAWNVHLINDRIWKRTHIPANTVER